MSEAITTDSMSKQLRDNAAVLLGPSSQIPHAAIAGALQMAADEIDRLNRICKKQEATIQRYEDAAVNGDDDE